MATRGKDPGLSELVEALGKAEKRYCQLALENGQLGAGIGKEIFQAYLQHGEAAEDALRAATPDAPYLGHFSASKYQVSERILRAMRDFHEQGSIDARLHSLLQDIAFLHSKGLWPLLAKRLRKANRLALRYERSTIQMELIPWQRKLLFQQHPKNLATQLKDLEAKTEHLFQVIRLENRAETLHAAVFAMSKRKTRLESPGEIAELKALIDQSPDLGAPGNASFQVEVYHANTRGLAAFLTGDYPQAYQGFDAALKAIQARPEMLPQVLEAYRIALTNFSNCCFYLDRMPQFERAMAAMQRLKGLPPQDQLQFEVTRRHLELLYCLNNALFDHGAAILPALAKWIAANEQQLPKARLMLLRYNAALLQFMGGEYFRALRWLRPILNKPPTGQREDIYKFSHFLELLTYIEQQEEGPMESRLRSLERKKNRQTKKEPFLDGLLAFFQTWEKGREEEALLQLEELLEKIATAKSRPPFGCQETTFWMQSRKQGIPLKDYIVQQVRQRGK